MNFEDKEYASAEDEQADIDAFKASLNKAAENFAPIPWTMIVYALMEKAAELSFRMGDAGYFEDVSAEVYDMALSGDKRVLGVVNEI